MLQAPIVQSQNQGTLTLYRKPVDRPWRLLDAVQQVYSDGWCPEWCAYTYFKPNQRGTLLIHLGRTGFVSATAPPGTCADLGRHRQDLRTGRRRCSSTSTGARW